jgi:hypothetical protein
MIMKTQFCRDPEIIDLGVWKAPGAVQTPKIDDFWVPEKYIFMIISIRSWGYWKLKFDLRSKLKCRIFGRFGV